MRDLHVQRRFAVRVERGADDEAVVGGHGPHGVRGLVAVSQARGLARLGGGERVDAGRVQPALDALHVVALDREAREVPLVGWDARPLEFRQVGDVVLRPDVGPDEAAVVPDLERRRGGLLP